MSEVTLQYDGTQERYHAIRRRQAEEAAKILASASPWPKKASGSYAWKIRPEPGTDEETDPQD
jgi:hypothetical protein